MSTNRIVLRVAILSLLLRNILLVVRGNETLTTTMHSYVSRHLYHPSERFHILRVGRNGVVGIVIGRNTEAFCRYLWFREACIASLCALLSLIVVSPLSMSIESSRIAASVVAWYQVAVLVGHSIRTCMRLFSRTVNESHQHRKHEGGRRVGILFVHVGIAPIALLETLEGTSGIRAFEIAKSSKALTTRRMQQCRRRQLPFL